VENQNPPMIIESIPEEVPTTTINEPIPIVETPNPVYNMPSRPSVFVVNLPVQVAPKEQKRVKTSFMIIRDNRVVPNSTRWSPSMSFNSKTK